MKINKKLLILAMSLTLCSCNLKIINIDKNSSSENISSNNSDDKSSNSSIESTLSIDEPSDTISIIEKDTSNDTSGNTISSDISSETIIEPTNIMKESIINSKNVKNAFGTMSWYTNKDSIPFKNINLNKYGRDVCVGFYIPKSLGNNPYAAYSPTNYYTSSYQVASSYEDSQLRTMEGIVSGDISSDNLANNHETPNNGHNPTYLDRYIRNSTAYYVINPNNGDYIAYILPSLNIKEEPLIIYYNAGYTSLNEEAAYLLAFGEVPPSSNYDSSTSGKEACIDKWGKFGRCNIQTFSDNYLNSNYRYEPALRDVYDNGSRVTSIYTYTETDYGSTGNSPSSTNSNKYNTGSKITRGTCRFVFNGDKDATRIDDRSVFYTNNHYADFQEFLNYKDGWGAMFGNESVGNIGTNYVSSNPPSNYQDVECVYASLEDINIGFETITYSVNYYLNGVLVKTINDVSYGTSLSSLTSFTYDNMTYSSSTYTYRSESCNSYSYYISNQVINNNLDIYYKGN